MRITDHVYKLTGTEYGINSCMYGLDTGDSIVLLDAGYQEAQWKRMKQTLADWGLDQKPISHVFITHDHFDHAGNVFRANEEGIYVVAGAPDADIIEQGNPESEELFHTKWICGKVDERAEDGKVYQFGNGISVEAMKAPGHTAGTFAYIIHADGHKILFAGDMFFVGPLSPDDGVSVELAYMGSSDFTIDGFVETLDKVRHLHCDIMLTGHYYTYIGDVDSIADQAWELAKEEQAKMKAGQ